jgi:hypothetical protein
VLFLRCLRREGAAIANQAASRLGAAAAGGTLADVVAVLWYTSALWYYNGYQLPHI